MDEDKQSKRRYPRVPSENVVLLQKLERGAEEELAKTPPVAIAATVSMSGNITVDVTFANTGSSAISGAELYVVLYEDLGEDEHHYTVRDILEPQEIASLAAGASQQISVTSNYSGSTANLHAVVFIKALDGEILQAALAG